MHNFLGKQSITVHPRYAVSGKRNRDGSLVADLTAFPKTHPSYVLCVRVRVCACMRARARVCVCMAHPPRVSESLTLIVIYIYE